MVTLSYQELALTYGFQLIACVAAIAFKGQLVHEPHTLTKPRHHVTATHQPCDIKTTHPT